MTNEDIDQIVQGIEEFIICGDPDVQEIWQPYIDKLNELKSVRKGRSRAAGET
jgi:hypothetical protein